MKIVLWMAGVALASVLIPLAGTAAYVFFYSERDEIPTARAIVVLAAGTIEARDPGVRSRTQRRLDRGIELYKAGKAPLLVMSGGIMSPPLAQQMKAVAVAAGVPEDAVLVEDKSRSTLENALFTADLPLLDKKEPIILVTHRYHLPRAHFSFRWAGFRSVVNVAADPADRFRVTDNLMWESVKWPVNVLRAAAASVAMALGVSRADYTRYLY